MIEKIIALISAFIMLISTLFGMQPDMKDPEIPNENPGIEIEKPEPGTLAEYDVENADYSLYIDKAYRLNEISDLLYGIFFEDINFAADGGLYAEMVQNRSFEFTELALGNEEHAWVDIGTVSSDVVKNDADGCLNINNPNYMLLTNTSGEKAGIANVGFLDGMAVKEGEAYTFSLYAKSADYTGDITVELRVGNAVAASAVIGGITSEWTKFEVTFTSALTAIRDVSLAVLIDNGQVAVDMISLIPDSSVNNLRADLVQALADLQPKFLRFPGGCVIEGHSLALAYDWKDSVGQDENGDPFVFNGAYGDVAARKQGQNIWTNEFITDDRFPSYMTYGLGFYEYFELAESIGAIGVPVINCGICCMGRGDETEYTDLGSPELQYYIQNMLDLVEFCRGDASTKWGAARIAMGHEEPFALKYIGIGNEQYGTAFYEHYEAFVDAFLAAKAENPELYDGLELIYSAGVDDGDSGNPDHLPSYTNAENWLAANPDKVLSDFAGATDQHYYNDPGWFLTHTDYYDEANYSRSKTDLDSTKFGGGIPVFVGEYAARSNRWSAGLSEAAYMTGLERNGDIVVMAAYAPLFGNTTATHWSPNLIWFNNHSVTRSVNYYAQKVFSINQGKYILKHRLTDNRMENEVPDLTGKVGVGTWNTKANFFDVKITDNATGKVLARDSFNRLSVGNSWEKVADGDWDILAGMLRQKSGETDIYAYNNTGTAMYFGDASWSNYTYTVHAVKKGGWEGFLIPFAVGDADNNFMWNVGGWWNTKSALQKVEAGSKSAEIIGTEKPIEIVKDQTYELKVVVDGRNVKCYVDGELYVDYDVPVSTLSDVYSVVSTDDTGDTIIKLVNVSDEVQTVAIDIANAGSVQSDAVIYEVIGSSYDNDNMLDCPEVVTMTEGTLEGVSAQFNYTVPAMSVIVIRVAE